MLRLACSMHLYPRALLRMPRCCTQRDLRTVSQRIMPYLPQAALYGPPQAAIGQPPMFLCSQLCIMRYLWPELLGNPPLVALPLLSFQLMRLPCRRHPLPVRMYGSMYGGGAKYASKVNLWPHGFACMHLDGGDEQAFLRALDVSANLNHEVRDVEEDVVLFQNQFLTDIVILTGDGKGMQATGGGWV